MAMIGRLLQVVVLVLGLCVLAEHNPNVRARINLSAFKFVSENAKHVADIEVPKIVLPDITQEFKPSYGTGKVSVSELKITEFHSPKSTILRIWHRKGRAEPASFNFFPTNHGVSWSSEQGTVSVTGRWAAEYRLLVPVWSSGWVNVRASDIRLNVSGNVMAKNYRPQIGLGNCAAEIGTFQIEIGGGMIPWLVNLFRNVISNAIQNAIRDQACETARSIILTEINDHLLSLPLHLPVWEEFYVDYAIEQSPNFTSSYVEAEAAAEAVYGSQNCSSPKIQEWTEVDLVPRMAVMWISESVPNCLLRSAHEGKLVRYTVTKENPSAASYLRTSCSFLSVCIGRFFPKLSTDYPDHDYVDVHFQSHEAPYVQMRNGVIKFNSTFAVDFYIHPMKNHSKSLARLMLKSSSSLLPKIVGNKLTANVTETENHFEQVFSDIGVISHTFLYMFGKMFSMATNVMVRWMISEGVPIPIFDNVTISGASEIRAFEKFIRVNADLEFR